jgi:tRNA(fMet)-specific endonuclease VapC
MTLLLDTAILIDIERRNKELIASLQEIIETDPAPANVSFISYFEFIYGLQKKSSENKTKSLLFIEKFPFLEPTKKTAIILSDLKSKYDKMGKALPLSDLLIASQAIEQNMTLVTRDRHFEEIQELKKIIL